MNRITLISALIGLAGALTAGSPVLAGGISADAGLTPPEGRWILRSQLRLMSREAPDSSGDMSMQRWMVPLVVVHGATPAWTLGLRQPLEFRRMTMNGRSSDASGFGDLYLFVKYKALRRNTRAATVGLSPVLGLELPTGSRDLSNHALNLNAGLYASLRAGYWALDLNLDYGAKGLAGVAASDPDPGDEMGCTLALARQIPAGSSGEVSVAPVFELTWTDTRPDEFAGATVPNTGEEIFSLAPGLKFTRGDVIVEGLVRVPVAQSQHGRQTEVGIMYLTGLRYMF